MAVELQSFLKREEELRNQVMNEGVRTNDISRLPQMKFPKRRRTVAAVKSPGLSQFEDFLPIDDPLFDQENKGQNPFSS